MARLRPLYVRTAALAAAVLVVAGMDAGAFQNRIDEAQARAGFLLNCVMFIDWPPAAVAGGDITVGILNDDALVGVIEGMQGRKVKDRVLHVKAVRIEDDLRPFHILFVGDGSGDVASVLARVADAPIVTVGVDRSFTSKGGMVRLYTEDDRLRFEINVVTAERLGLKVSARMLGLARIVR